MVRNRELRFIAVAAACITAACSAAAFRISEQAGWITLTAAGLLILLYAIYTLWRYREISRLSDYLKRIDNGDYSLDIRDNREGELSILKNEIYKVTSRLAEQAEALNADKKYLADSLSDISHQLKTPLTSMFMLADLLRQDNLPQEKREEFTGTICSQLDRIEWLVSSLLKMSKLDAGTVELKKDRVFVMEVMEKASEHLMIPMDIKNQHFVLDGDGDASYRGDFSWSSEAFANILKNCMEHTPAGGTITVSFEENNLYTMIQIRDNGGGIDKEDLPHIFERFYKGKNASRDSVGIGLAMAKNILMRQGGIIDVESEPGQGTAFIIKMYK